MANQSFPDGRAISAQMRKVDQYAERIPVQNFLSETPVRQRVSVIEVPLEKIVRSSRFQTRQPFDPASDEEDRVLADSIEAIGQRRPVGLHEFEPGLYEIVWGHRRIAALRLLNKATVLAITTSGDDKDRATDTAVENSGRPLSPIEKGELACLLRDELGMSSRDIAVRLGIRQRWVQRLQQFMGAPECLRVAVRDHGLAVDVAVELLRAPAQYQPDAIALVITHNLSEPKVKKLVQRMVVAGELPDQAVAALGVVQNNGQSTAGVSETFVETSSDPAGNLHLEVLDNDDHDHGFSEPLDENNVALSSEVESHEPDGAIGTPTHGTNSSTDNGEPKSPQMPVEMVLKTFAREFPSLSPQTARAIATRGIEQSFALREFRIAGLISLAMEVGPAEAVNKALQLKDDQAMSIAVLMVEQLARVRVLIRKRQGNDYFRAALKMLQKDVSAILVECRNTK